MSSGIFDDREKKEIPANKRIGDLQAEITRLKDTITEIASENLERKKTWKLVGEKMTSLMPDIHMTVEKAQSRSGLPLWRILKTLGTSRAWY